METARQFIIVAPVTKTDRNGAFEMLVAWYAAWHHACGRDRGPRDAVERLIRASRKSAPSITGKSVWGSAATRTLAQ